MNNVKKQSNIIAFLSGVYPRTKQIKSTSKFKLSVGVIKSLKKLDSLEHGVGVYFFKDARGRIIYIGKAVNLKARVRSYFIKNSLYGIKASMLSEIKKIDYKITDTEIDALILESQLIKKYLPKYNVLLKDDKNYFYVIFTNEQFPKVFITHQPHKIRNSLSSPRMRGSRSKSNLDSRFRGNDTAHRSDLFYIGPYTDGQALKTTLRYLRKIFPYCTCKTQHNLPCLKSHLGLCMGMCCLKQEFKALNSKLKAREYRKNIKTLIDVLSGRKKMILKKLEKEMKIAAEKEDFEKAASLRNKINALSNIFQHKIIGVKEVESRNCRGSTSIVAAKDEISRIFGVKIDRIEFYDVSNISGQLAVASMVVFDGERINYSEYRKFKIKTVFGVDDPAMMKEALARRLNHKEWKMPDLIIVDGGIAQFNAARDVLTRFCHSPDFRSRGNLDSMNAGLDPRFPIAVEDRFYGEALVLDTGDDRKKVKIASLAKNPDRLFFCLTSDVKQLALKNLLENTILLLQNLRDEAHRFAIGYHRKLRSKRLESDFYIK